MKEEFREILESFLKDFKRSFIEFFSSQCNGYDYSLENTEVENLAQEILDNLFSQKVVMSKEAKNTILKMKHDGVFIGFLLNKTLFYMLENYIRYLEDEKLERRDYFEDVVRLFGRFSHLLEEYIDKNMLIEDEVISFTDNNYIYLRNHILDIFYNIKKRDSSIEFMNLYQGYPIRSKAKILSIEDTKITFKIENELQEIAMKLEGKAYMLKDKFFHRYVKADIVYCNFPNRTVVLNNFRYTVNLPAVHRKNPRIYPNVLVHAKLGRDKHLQQIVGNLYDLSKDGLGMISKENIDFYNGAKINIEFALAYEDKKYNIKTIGEIVDIMQHMDSYRYCLKISPDKENTKAIADYIEKREEGIKKELKGELSM